MMIYHGIKHSRSQDLIDFAFRFSVNVHDNRSLKEEGKYRKYTGEPYWIHPMQVAQLVSQYTDDCEIISAVFLHDVLEDTDVTFEELVNVGFGHSIARLVWEVTDQSVRMKLNRIKRKEIDRIHLANASNRAQTIKYADNINNACSIIVHDTNFAKTYMREISLNLESMNKGNKELYQIISNICTEYDEIKLQEYLAKYKYFCYEKL